MTLQKDFYLRVRNNSELGKVLTALIESDKPLSEQEVKAVGGLARSPKSLKYAAQWFDNLTASWKDDKYTAKYTDVVGRAQTVVNVEQADFSGGGDGYKKQDDSDHEQVRWPAAPPIIEPFDFFRTPSYYKTMEAMVEDGSHISFAGPPSVGKDTTIEQLAATHNEVLVTINGSGLRKRDLIGSPEMFNGSTYFLVAEAAAAVVNGWWLSLTEVNAADPDVLILLNSLMDEPFSINIRGKHYPVHKNFRLFVSYNPGLVGTKPIPPSFHDRFFPIKISFLTEKELRARLEAKGLPSERVTINEGQWNEKVVCTEEWADKIVEFGINLWKAHEDGKLRYQVTIRRLGDAIKLMNKGITTDVKKALKQGVIAAIDSPVESKVAERVLKETMEAV